MEPHLGCPGGGIIVRKGGTGITPQSASRARASAAAPAALAVVALFLAPGVGKSIWPFAKKEPAKEAQKPDPRDPLDYPTVGTNTGVDGLAPLKVEGIGLVVGLPGTGSDPPPNRYRQMMLEIMGKHDTHNANAVLASDQTAIVLLRAFIPPGARKGDLVDVEVWVPPGDQTSSLEGGYLLEASLHVTVVFQTNRTGSARGDELVRVQGPVLIMERSKSESGSAKRGVILGQGRVLEDRNFRLGIARDMRSGRRTKSLSHRINQRFPPPQGDRSKLVAVAKDDKLIELRLTPSYRHDVRRYLLVVQRIPTAASESLERGTREALEEALHDPQRALDAALRLEAIGEASLPILKEGLTDRSEVVRFASAQTLAYLGDPSGSKELGTAAERSNTYRPYAITALAALSHPSARMELARLLDVAGAETRYAAFRALRLRDPQDPLVRGEEVGGVALHWVDSQSEPMVHVLRTGRQEIVLFGPHELSRPLSLQVGDSIVLTASEGEDSVHLASFRAGAEGTVQVRSDARSQLEDVIRKAAELGATYGEIVQMLETARSTGNLTGRLEVDALPKALWMDTLAAVAVADDQSNSAQAREASQRKPKKTWSMFPLWRRQAN